jgi:outer membrane protein TolC
LPIPAPQLYAYDLPELEQRSAARFRPDQAGLLQPLPRRGEQNVLLAALASRASSVDQESVVQAASYHQPEQLPLQSAEEAPALNGPAGESNGEESNVEESDPADSEADDYPSPYATSSDNELIVVPIPRAVWESLPPSCLNRMFEFESVRAEYRRTYGTGPSGQAAESAPKFALEDILEQSLINSREYQRQKELLYVTALRLTLERYAYDLKFDPFGNGTDVDFVHNRVAGITQNTLAVPTRLRGSKLLATGGNLVASFANDVVLTFNGPGGFGKDVSSELFFSLSQSVFQRDIVLESLTQSERDVIYAARDFARFRKTFFQDQANRYYALILTYRGIEIDSQNYFSNLRAFNQGQAEFGAGRLPRIQVDQFEQNALSGRSSLIGRCNSLESNLDTLKLAIGLPPELPINLDLTELELLTLRDEATVSAELVRRARRILVQERAADSPDRISLLNYAIDLTRRMMNLEKLRARLIDQQVETQTLETLLAELLVEESQILVGQNEQILLNERDTQPSAPPLRIFQRTTELIDSQLSLIRLYEDLRARRDPASESASSRQTVTDLQIRLNKARRELSRAIEQRQLSRLPEFVKLTEQLLSESTALLRQTVPDNLRLDPAEDLKQIATQVDALITASGQAITSGSSGLSPITLEGDDAMLTALSQRFDLMNQRGVLADAWRQIKLAGDDLKSVLNLSASQSVRTDLDTDEPFDFTFDNSTTQLNLSFDAPLNRKAQRNDFRVSLINYNLALRNLIELEDTIKLNIRDDLRDLQLDREQYDIAVASAALAYERVLSTRLQLQLGVENVAARDFLEAQQAYTESLSSVASQHIGFITDRIALFVDLELLEVNQSGFWPELYQEQMQPEPSFAPPSAAQPYGTLPPQVWHTKSMRRMLEVPYGQPIIYNAENATPDEEDASRRATAEELPLPESVPL